VLATLLAATLTVTAASPRGAVATAHPLASEAAAAVLRAGGNAADAAVAAAFALSVVEPESSGIGGGGFAVVYVARERRVHVLDFREAAPAAARADMFEGAPEGARPSLDGGLAVAVPGAVKGYAALARRFGSRPLPALVEPAARLAERGFRVGAHYAEAARARLECLRADAAASREFLVRAGDRLDAPAPGWRLVRRDKARTLRRLGRDPDAFHRGPLADRIAAAARARGGVLAAEDLAAYAVKEREPLEGRYRGHRIVSVPPPSAGGAIVIGLLQALEGEDPRAGGYRPERFLHAMVEASKRLYARRGGQLGDPDQVPGALAAAREMASPAFAAALRSAYGERAAPSTQVAAPRREAHTSHVSVVDREGNAVALTTTVNTWFGACVVVPGTGILLNDEMDDFDAAPGRPNAYGLVGTGANAPAPAKRPLSSMAPTLVFDPGDRLVLVVGAPGGSTIPTTVAQVIQRVLDDGMRVDEALAAPRLHHQWLPDRVRVEPNGLDAATARALAARGHDLDFAARRWGNAQAVRVDPATGLREAASDPRGEGAPAVP
jgi:gamma-glutamyltranspeptidase/glutathione hydrolase